jgi:hypothetical protein
MTRDLRGPLSVARVGASLLVKAPERLDERRDLAVRIVAAIDSTDRMVRGLRDFVEHPTAAAALAKPSGARCAVD